MNLNFKEFLAESTDGLLVEATKKEILDYMAKASWDEKDSYAFAIQAMGHGIFKSENVAMKAFSKNYAEYSKMTHGTSKKAVLSGGKVVSTDLATYMKGGSAPAPRSAPAPKAAPKPEKPKNVPGLVVNGSFGSVIGADDLVRKIDKMIPLLRDNGDVYKAIDVYLDNLEKFRKSQGSSLGNAETRYAGEVKIALVTLRTALVQLSKDANIPFKM